MKKVVGRKEKFGSSSKREARFFWKGILFASPWLIGFVCFILLPVCLAFYYSFTDYNLFNEPAWVGLKNYKDAFKDQYVCSITVMLHLFKRLTQCVSFLHISDLALWCQKE